MDSFGRMVLDKWQEHVKIWSGSWKWITITDKLETVKPFLARKWNFFKMLLLIVVSIPAFRKKGFISKLAKMTNM